MDNQNDPNSQNNPNPAPPPPANPWSTLPTSSPQPDLPTPTPWTTPAQPIANTPTEPAPAPMPWAPEPTAVQAPSDVLPPQDQIPASPTQPASTLGGRGEPTWTPPPQTPQPAPVPSPALSPLDNPWEAPSQPPSINGSGTTIQPSWTTVPNTPTPPAPSESAPTDLSHLITNNNAQQETIQPIPETLVVPSTATANPQMSALSTEKHKGIPKWVIGLGIGLLIVVIGATAYLILGIGQPAKTTSIPAVTTPKTAEVKPPAPIATPVVQPSEQPAASGADNFGELEGGSGGTQATSAAELLRQRQQGR